MSTLWFETNHWTQSPLSPCHSAANGKQVPLRLTCWGIISGGWGIWWYLEAYGGICRYLEVSGGIWRYLEVSEGIWRHLEASRGMRRYQVEGTEGQEWWPSRKVWKNIRFMYGSGRSQSGGGSEPGWPEDALNSECWKINGFWMVNAQNQVGQRGALSSECCKKQLCCDGSKLRMLKKQWLYLN